MQNKLAIALALAGASLVTTASAAPDPKAPAAAAPKTVVLVHGAFADGSSWDKVIPILQAKGFNVIAVQNPLTSLADDVAATKRAIETAPGKVILVGHSWGGVVITEAGTNDKVESLVYVAAFAPDAGESVTDLGKGQPPPPWQAALKVDSGGFARLPDENVAKDFAQDLPAVDQKIVAAKQGPTAVKAFGDKISTPAWKTKPSWYIVADADHMIPPAAEGLMAKRAGSTTSTLKGSHVIMISKPKEVAAVILAAAAGKK